MARFVPSGPCWICEEADLRPIHENVFDLSIYHDQDPELAAYTGASVTIVRCRRCGFAQPQSLPSLDRFFERMYDQRWAREWTVSEFASEAKTGIFSETLQELGRRVAVTPRRLLDVGAHVGKFIAMASDAGWVVEGVETNPTTASYARERTSLPIHQGTLSQLARAGRQFEAVTLIDVLEHLPQPLAVLRDAAAVLVPGGWISVKVPCGPNQLRKERLRVRLGRSDRISIADNLVHVSHFSPYSLRLALAEAGFHQVRLMVGRPERCIARSFASGMVANAGRAMLLHAARLWPGGVRSPLAFNLQAYARRTESPS